VISTDPPQGTSTYRLGANQVGSDRDLIALADEHPDSWLDFLAKDVANNGAEHGRVNRKYRPRVYNEGPKE